MNAGEKAEMDGEEIVESSAAGSSSQHAAMNVLTMVSMQMLGEGEKREFVDEERLDEIVCVDAVTTSQHKPTPSPQLAAIANDSTGVIEVEAVSVKPNDGGANVEVDFF